MNLFVFGLGYSATHYVREARAWTHVAGTVRSPEKAEALRPQGWDVHLFDGETLGPALAEALTASDALLVSVQPDRQGDPVLRAAEAAIAAAPRLRRIVYLSTVGVYGDHGGAWIDEATPAEPTSERGRVRLAVETAWHEAGARHGRAVQVLRLAGIYGPGRNALDDLRAGEARRVDKPGQVFNRIHVADIGGAIEAAFAFDGPSRTWNVADDEPAPAPAVVDYAAGLMGIEPPRLIPFAEADLSPMARSFYAANRRIRNRALREDLGVRLRYPTFRAGLDALWAAGEGRDSTSEV